PQFLAGEYTIEILETFHLDGITARIEEEHGSLLAGFAFKTHHRWNIERNACLLQPASKREPCVQRQHDAQMRHHHHVVSNLACSRHFERLSKVKRNLVSEEIKIDPGIRAATLFASKNGSVKRSGLVKAGD